MKQESAQKLISKHPGLELVDARFRLANTPESAPMIRKLLQLKIQNLERELNIQSGNKPPMQERQDVERANGVRAPVDEVPVHRDVGGIDRLHEPSSPSRPRTDDAVARHLGEHEVGRVAGERIGEGEAQKSVGGGFVESNIRKKQLAVLLLVSSWCSICCIYPVFKPKLINHPINAVVTALLLAMPALIFGGVSMWWLSISVAQSGIQPDNPNNK